MYVKIDNNPREKKTWAQHEALVCPRFLLPWIIVSWWLNRLRSSWASTEGLSLKCMFWVHSFFLCPMDNSLLGTNQGIHLICKYSGFYYFVTCFFWPKEVPWMVGLIFISGNPLRKPTKGETCWQLSLLWNHDIKVWLLKHCFYYVDFLNTFNALIQLWCLNVRTKVVIVSVFICT